MKAKDRLACRGLIIWPGNAVISSCLSECVGVNYMCVSCVSLCAAVFGAPCYVSCVSLCAAVFGAPCYVSCVSLCAERFEAPYYFIPTV